MKSAAAASSREAQAAEQPTARKSSAGSGSGGAQSVEVLPGPAASSDAALDDCVRSTAVTIFHPVGTCRMGVDPQLRLRGIDGLRTADASVMPHVIGGNTNACVMMIAEKACDLIARWSRNDSLERRLRLRHADAIARQRPCVVALRWGPP